MRAHIAKESEPTDRYVLERVLGQGAMGIVVLAYDSYQRRHVALKTLLPESRPQHHIALPLEQEIMQGLHHPNILNVLDYGELSNGRPYYTMPLIKGTSLDHLVSKGRISLHSAIHTLRTVCGALEHAHQRGVVHCDLKPGNILFSAHGETYLIDWGTSASFRALLRSPEATSASDGNRVYGTPLYLAPEVLRGKQPTPAADMYAIGVILYRLLSGTYPFHDKDVRTLFRRACQEQVASPQQHVSHHVPEELEQLCLQLLSKEPDQRGVSCLEVGQRLHEWYESVRRVPRTPRPRWFSSPFTAKAS